MLYFSLTILALLINPNLRIINKKISRIDNVIKNGNLTEPRLKLVKDKLYSVNIQRYGIIIREPLE